MACSGSGHSVGRLGSGWAYLLSSCCTVRAVTAAIIMMVSSDRKVRKKVVGDMREAEEKGQKFKEGVIKAG